MTFSPKVAPVLTMRISSSSSPPFASKVTTETPGTAGFSPTARMMALFVAWSVGEKKTLSDVTSKLPVATEYGAPL